MNILLVRPPRMKQSINLSEIMFSEPIGLEMIYSLLKDTHTIEIVDLMVETRASIKELLAKKKYDMVGITSLCIDVGSVHTIAKEVKSVSKDLIVFVGGTQAYLVPESFFIPEIDYVFKYTTQKNMREFVTSIEGTLDSKERQIQPIDGIYMKNYNYSCKNIVGYNEYIIPDREVTRKYRNEYSYFGYKPCAIIGTSLGCSKHCDFCLRWRMEGAVETYRNIEEVIQEIKNIKEKSVMIYDNDFLHNKERLNTFCEYLVKEKIEKNFICYASVRSILENTEEITHFAALGLKAVLVGYESFSETELQQYKKKSSLKESLDAASILKKIHVDCWASFIAHPDWNKQDFKNLRKFIYKLKPENTTISPLTPFQTLPLHKTYKERLLYSKDNYGIWSFGNVTIRPLKLSLRQYYNEMFLTILYVNLFTNRPLHMLKRYGLKNVIRLLKGALKVSARYKKQINDLTQ